MVKHSKHYYDTTRNLSYETIKKNKKMNWINSWNTGNKKLKYEIEIRIGKITILDIKACLFCDVDCAAKRFRFIVFNLGFEI